MEKITLKKGEGHEGMILCKDDNSTFCPFLQPMMSVSALGKQAIVRFSCNSLCPHFAIISDQYVRISCGGVLVDHKITKPV